MPERFISLAESLGLIPPPDNSSQDESPAVSIDHVTSAQDFCQKVLSSRDFRRYIVDGLTLGSLPAAIITRLMDYGWGKPADRLEIKDVTHHIEELSAEQLEQRALFLVECARRMRQVEDALEPRPAGPSPPVH